MDNQNEIIELIKEQNRLNRELLDSSKKETITAEKLIQVQKDARKEYLKQQQVEFERITIEKEKLLEVEEFNKATKELITVVNNLIAIVFEALKTTKEDTSSINSVLKGLQIINTMVGTEVLKLLVKEKASKDQLESLTKALIAIGETKNTLIDMSIKADRDITTGDNTIGDVHKS